MSKVRVLAVSRGKMLHFEDPPMVRQLLANLDGKRLAVSIEPLGVTRSSQQNRWYWGGIVPVVGQHLSQGRDLDLHPSQVHYLLKSAFLGVDETALGPVPKRSRDLTTAQFSAYCEEIRAHAASEWGLPIPGPEEYE